MKTTKCVLPLLAVAALLVGCASGRGSTFRESSEGEASAAAKSAEAARKNSPPPVAPPSEGASPSLPMIILSQSYSTTSAPPPPVATGTLVVNGLPEGATLWLDGVPRIFGSGSSFTQTLPVDAGSHYLAVERFGYADVNASFEVADGGAFAFDVRMEPVPFAVREVGVWPEAFDPLNPGFLGSATVEVEATAAGTFRVEVVDGAGSTVRRTSEIEVRSRHWYWRWDGRDEEGFALAKGRYRIRAVGEDGAVLAESPVELRSDIISRSALLFSGTGGSLFVPAARPIEGGRLESVTGVAGHIVDSTGGTFGRLTAYGGLRFGIPSFDGGGSGGGSEAGSELDISAMFVLHPGSSDPISSDSVIVTGALLMPMGRDPIRTAILAKFSYGSFIAPDAGDWPSPWDGATRYPGLSVALPIEIDQGNLRGFLAPEFEISTFYPGYDPARVPGIYAWGYLRGGFELTLGPVTASLSAALRSLPLDQAFGLALPLPFGLELRWHSSEAPLVVSFIASGEIDARSSWYASAGLCVGSRL